ncbi:hypothetical protein OU5_4589 [Pseudomonas mandelii JR-1]|uniref:Uncharacterized protein n=1 Tax=Pseudomonas mandelii JR-1 TaxID=1147786 RepID=A0A024EH52_9PSED|nr:hypothetical protein OU5_4589 [Pseudomonas mandelii JR-1]
MDVAHRKASTAGKPVPAPSVRWGSQSRHRLDCAQFGVDAFGFRMMKALKKKTVCTAIMRASADRHLMLAALRYREQARSYRGGLCN